MPFFSLGVYNLELPGLGLIPIDPWATLVCLACVVGMEMARYRAIRLGMNVSDVVDACVFIVVMGFAMGHIVTVVAYHPERLATDGIWAILRFWQGFSSFGGFLGAVFGAIVFFRYIRPLPFWRYADVIAYGFPFGWIFGRLGCSVVHDHVGKIAPASFPLAMDFDHGYRSFAWVDGDPYPWAEGIRYELGLLEFVMFVIVAAIFWQLGKVDRPPGFFLGVLAVGYAPVRFGLDFLRNTDLQYQDARYGALTPAQWGCIVMFALGVWSLWRIDFKGFRPWALDGAPNQGERALKATG